MSDLQVYRANIEALAQDLEITLYQRFTTESAADILGVSIPTLNRIRARGDIAYLRLGDRQVRFFGFQLMEYLINSIEEASCHDMQGKTDTKLEATGSDKEIRTARPPGTECGGMPKLDAPAALVSAQQILKKPSSD